MSGNYIFDPCFSSPKAQGVVLCVVSPWSRSGVEIVLTKRLPNPCREAFHDGASLGHPDLYRPEVRICYRRHDGDRKQASQLWLQQQRMAVGGSLPQLGAVDDLRRGGRCEAPLEASQDRRCLVLIAGTPRLREGGVFFACPGRGWPAPLKAIVEAIGCSKASGGTSGVGSGRLMFRRGGRSVTSRPSWSCRRPIVYASTSSSAELVNVRPRRGQSLRRVVLRAGLGQS